jgi:hypothetical protein
MPTPRSPKHRKMSLLLAIALCCTLVTSCSTVNPIAKTHAVAYAKGVNLNADDVSRSTISAMGFQTRSDPPFGHCTTHVGRSDEIAAVESPWFLRAKSAGHNYIFFAAPQSPVEGIHSVVYVMRDTRDTNLASRNIAAARGVGVPGCVEQMKINEIKGRFIGHEPYKLQIKVSSLSFPLLGTVGYGVRVSGTVAGTIYHDKKRLPFYEDTFGFAVGPAEVVLHADGVARPVPPTEVRRLLSLLYNRAKAHTV